jgi:glycosyltransferase involved in cell wall biosynthesis
MNNRFLIIVGSRNNEKWVESNIKSILSQDYSNYKVLYFDDASEDNTAGRVKEIVGKDSRFDLYISEERKYKTWFFSHILPSSDRDILVFLDGDDFFASENVLSYINEVYNQSDCWMTYGGMRVWDGINEPVEPYPQNSEIPLDIIKHRAYRKDTWRTSHLKTMRGFLWKSIDKKDLCPDGKYMVGPDDLAIMYAALELCPPSKVYRVKDPLYIYNHSDANENSRAFKDHNNCGINYENIVRTRIPYDTLSFVTPLLAGGLGNQMFEIAAAASLAKDNNAILIINNEEHILPNQGRNINNYLDNIFSKISIDKNLPIEHIYKWDLSTYRPIKYQPNIKTMGHFQSWRYFHHNQDYIKGLFAPTDEIRQVLKTMEYLSEYTILQVRRGDYYKFPDHHPQLIPDYFYKAVNQINPNKILIFSDDIDWCKKNLTFSIKCEYNTQSFPDYLELYMMTLCKNLVVSNSSFGWWAAYLNSNPHRKIYVPSIWFGKYMLNEGFNIDDLVLNDWIKIQI